MTEVLPHYRRHKVFPLALFRQIYFHSADGTREDATLCPSCRLLSSQTVHSGKLGASAGTEAEQTEGLVGIIAFG